MKTVLLCVLIGIHTTLKAQAIFSKEKLDLAKFSGFWYEVGTSSSSDWFLKQKGSKRLGAVIVTQEENKVRVKIVYDKLKKCIKEDILGNLDIPGKFVFSDWVSPAIALDNSNPSKNPFRSVSGSREADVLDTDYDNYAIVNFSILKKGTRFNILKFFSRTLNNTDEGLKRLRETSAKLGISTDNVFMLICDDTCVKMLKKVNPFVSLLLIEIDSRRYMTSIAQDVGMIVAQNSCPLFNG